MAVTVNELIPDLLRWMHCFFIYPHSTRHLCCYNLLSLPFLTVRTWMRYGCLKPTQMWIRYSASPVVEKLMPETCLDSGETPITAKGLEQVINLTEHSTK